MMRFRPLLAFLLMLGPSAGVAQHQHDHGNAQAASHAGHIKHSRENTVYIYNLPPPQLMEGIRKKKYEGSFFMYGVMVPASMELCFGFYDKAAERLKAISDPDSLYGGGQYGL